MNTISFFGIIIISIIILHAFNNHNKGTIGGTHIIEQPLPNINSCLYSSNYFLPFEIPNLHQTHDKEDYGHTRVLEPHPENADIKIASDIINNKYLNFVTNTPVIDYVNIYKIRKKVLDFTKSDRNDNFHGYLEIESDVLRNN